MDAYPIDYVNHNLPLVLLSGLDAEPEDGQGASVEYPLLAERGHKIFSDFPPLSGFIAEELRRVLLEENGSQMPWRATTGSTGSSPPPHIVYKIKSTGRSYQLPPRKADPPRTSPPASPTTADNETAVTSTPTILHSPISPLSPGSPTFPDGLLTPLWVTKHQELVPAAVINFFPLSLDPNMDSLRDNQLKIEINSLKGNWASSGYRPRFLVVLISEEGQGGYIGEIDDRVAGIRRATNLDQKSIFVVPPDATSTELKDIKDSLLSLLQPSVVEYYRELSKHARRKRNRSSIPPPTAPPTSGTSQTLSFQGWNVRYEFKLGILAEFRQEMDAACRNYEGAYETLFGQEVFENIPGWSSRFNDARLLGDALAIRIIRCLLWTNQTTAAARFWAEHRTNTKSIINRRGKGSKNYGWEAWEARWSLIMAQLMGQSETSLQFPEAIGDQANVNSFIYSSAEKSIPTGQMVNPWEHLHHEGYWLHRSAKHSMIRRALAQQIPDEDKTRPDPAQGSNIANKSYVYDTYLAPEPYIEAPQNGQPGFDHSHQILDTLKAALGEFSKRRQTRKVESLSLEIAEEYMRNGSWNEAYSALQPLWSSLSWRQSGWWQLMEKFGWALRESALKVEDSETVLRVDWELLNGVFTPRATWHYDIHRSLEGIPSQKPKPSVVLRAEDVITSLAASLVFEKSEGNVGEPLQAQLTITSCAQRSSCPIRLSEVKLVFEGCLRPIKLQYNENKKSDTAAMCSISSISLQDRNSSSDSVLQSPTTGVTNLVGTADLTIAPSQTKVFNLTCIPREAGEARVASIAMLIEEDNFDLTFVATDYHSHENFWWQVTRKGPSRRRVGKDRDTSKCKIMPKPPKIRISTPNLRDTYYTNERVALQISVHNEEDEAANVSSEIRLFGSPESSVKLEWADADNTSDAAEGGPSSPMENTPHVLNRVIGVMEQSSVRDLTVVLANTNDAAKYTLEISAIYHLVSDVQTPIIRNITVDLSFIRPFEANYEFLPRVHSHPWPDFFSVSDELVGDDLSSTPSGLLQRWCLNAKVVSFAVEPLVIDRMSLKVLGVTGDAVCSLENEVLISPETPYISLEELRDSNFSLELQKQTLGDRRPSAVNLALEIAWRRHVGGATASDMDDDLTISTLEIPRFVVPMGEPRVLASALASSKMPGLIHLDYTLENPSTHFLTFSLMLEASEQFAFSGPKSVVVQLVPLSRHTVRYNILAAKRGLWIQPQLVVVDTYFNKSLRVLPTGDMRSDKKGVLVWVDAED